MRSFAVAAAATALCVAHADDAYLRAVEREADRSGGVPAQLVAGQAPAGDDQGASPAAARDRFEATLREHYVGTYEIYTKLPDRSREEVFEDFRAGATLQQVRRKVVDRLLRR